jgi:glucose/arabinose dehydrogenase
MQAILKLIRFRPAARRHFNRAAPIPPDARKNRISISSIKTLVQIPGCASLILVGGAVAGATLPPGFSESIMASGLSNATAMEFAPDGRLFVCQQGGQLRVVKNGALLTTPFLTVTTDSSGERGLLGIAFDPNFANNQFLYIYYTVPGTTAHNRISRFTGSGDVAASASETVLLELNDLSGASNHNGGAIHFGEDGRLYAGVGDNANSANSQTLTNLLGKILRINNDGSIPTDNPFFSTAAGVNRAIWAMGLRNPFTFGVQPGSGRIFINDVGENTWEEIDDGVAGANYGWPNCEGACSPTNPSFRDPIYQYSHAVGCAIAGGAFYNPATTQFPPAYTGVYFFADLCGAWIRVLDPANNNEVTTFATGLSSPVDLKVSADGSLYYLDRGAGSVGRVQFTGNTGTVMLTLLTQPSGLSLTFDGSTVVTPYVAESVVGTTHTLGAPPSERLNKVNYRLVSWSDLGAPTHTITTPSVDTSYTALYQRKGHP